MTVLDLLVRTASAKALGWALVHSIWEGAAIALVLALVLAATRASRVRYTAACLALPAMLVCFAVTLYVFWPEPAASSRVDGRQAEAAGAQPSGIPSAAGPSGAQALLPWLAPVWLAGVLVFQTRWIAGWFLARRLRRTGTCAPPDIWIGRLGSLQARLRVAGAVTLLESCLTEVPVVIGYLRPVILMPVGLLTGLPVAQIEAILLHELAHIRRRDYLVNLIQALAESLLFYHPAVWWISNAIRSEREHCCDDLVVAASNGDAHGYARALAALAETRRPTTAALAATGGTLMHRMKRLLAQPVDQRPALAPVVLACLVTLTAAAAIAAVPSPVRLQIRATAGATPYDLWLAEDVVYIITGEERAAFRKLQTDEERQHFIEQFWLRRDPTPGTPENEFKEEHYRRIAYANERFRGPGMAGWRSDRGHIYINYGPPDEIESHPSGPPTPFEQWLYHHLEGAGDNVIIEFVDADGTGQYRMTRDPHPTPMRVVVGIINQIPFVEIPIEFSAPGYSVSGTIAGSDGRIQARFNNEISRSAQGSTVRPAANEVAGLRDGTYTVTAVVKNSDGSVHRDYTATFSLSTDRTLGTRRLLVY
jgi:GWxTD domain-containing protein